MAGDKGRGGGREKNDSAGNVHWITDTVESSNTLDDVGAKGWVGKSGVGARGGDKSGRNGVHRNVVLAPFDGEALGEMRDGRFGHAIDRLARKSDESRLRAEINDATAFLTNHDAPGRLTREERALEVDRDRSIKIGLGEVFGEIFRPDAPATFRDLAK